MKLFKHFRSSQGSRLFQEVGSWQYRSPEMHSKVWTKTTKTTSEKENPWSNLIRCFSFDLPSKNLDPPEGNLYSVDDFALGWLHRKDRHLVVWCDGLCPAIQRVSLWSASQRQGTPVEVAGQAQITHFSVPNWVGVGHPLFFNVLVCSLDLHIFTAILTILACSKQQHLPHCYAESFWLQRGQEVMLTTAIPSVTSKRPGQNPSIDHAKWWTTLPPSTSKQFAGTFDVNLTKNSNVKTR